MNEQILTAREEKINLISQLFNSYPRSSLITIKVNRPGLKNQVTDYFILKIFYNLIIKNFQIITAKLNNSFDGPFYTIVLKDKNRDYKLKLIELEETHPLGRLIDLDYFDQSDRSLSRTELNLPLRKCFLCNNPAFVCARNKTHKVAQLTHFIDNKFKTYFKEIFVDLADYAITRELKIETKFGLVSLTSSGSHHDMNHLLMLEAKNSILPFFNLMFEAGYQTDNLTTILKEVRHLGIEAEKKMLQTTSGINCYKGIIFLLGLIIIASSYTLKTSNKFADIFSNIKLIAHDIYADFKQPLNTYGSYLYEQYNIKGIRKTAFSGLQIIQANIAQITLNSNDDELRALLHSYMVKSEDTVFIKRSGSYQNYLKYKEIIAKYNPHNKSDLKALNEFCLTKSLSFGGSADLLICSIFLIHLKEFFTE